MYAETSFAGPSLFGERNPTPTHFQHIADWHEHRRLERKRAAYVGAFRRAA